MKDVLQLIIGLLAVLAAWGAVGVLRQPKLDTVELAVKVWSQRLGGSVTPEGVTEKIATEVAASRIDGLRDWASISPQETHEYATTESTEPTRCHP